MGERRFPHLRYDFHDNQRILGTAYYALFHGLAELTAGRLVGSKSATHNSLLGLGCIEPSTT
jgi:hypothetical protein